MKRKAFRPFGKKPVRFLTSLVLAVSLSAGIVFGGVKVLGGTQESGQSQTQVSAQSTEKTLYTDSLRRMMDLGVFTPTSAQAMDTDRSITREELAIVLIKATGQDEAAKLYKNTTLYSDVPSSRFSNGHVNAAVKLGYMTALADGKFHPSQTVSFTQAAVIMGKLLGYDESSLSGSYPGNYITLLENLDILDGISYTPAKALSRGQTALLLERVYETKPKGDTRPYIDTLANYKSVTVLENNVTHPDLSYRRILTEKGEFYFTDALSAPEAGKKYMLRIEEGQIVKMALMGLAVTEISLSKAASGKVISNDGTSLTLPSDATYYYGGKTASYSDVMGGIKANSSLVLGKNRDGTAYGVLFDPLYSDPVVISGDEQGKSLAARFGGKAIDRGGKSIDPNQIESDDVVYEVTDLWGRYGYVLVYNNAVSGTVTSIQPSKISPKSVEVDGKSYELASSFPVSKLTASGGIETGDTVKILLGSDGSAVDIVSSKSSDNGNYVLVLETYTKKSEDASDYGKAYDYVTLLHADGAKATYLLDGGITTLYRGSLALYEVVLKGKDYDTVKLTKLDGNTRDSYRITPAERKLNESYVAMDAVIFNITNTYTSEIQASVLKFSDLSSGTLEEGRVKYIRRTGDFQDVDVLLVDDALGENIRYAYVTGIRSSLAGTAGTSDMLTLLIEGQTYTLSGANFNVNLNSVVRVRMNGTQPVSLDYSLQPAAAGTLIEAVDASRIRINGTVYSFHKDAAVYRASDSGSVQTLKISDLTRDALYRSIGVYLDRPSANGGKAVVLVLR